MLAGKAALVRKTWTDCERPCLFYLRETISKWHFDFHSNAREIPTAEDTIRESIRPWCLHKCHQGLRMMYEGTWKVVGRVKIGNGIEPHGLKKNDRLSLEMCFLLLPRSVNNLPTLNFYLPIPPWCPDLTVGHALNLCTAIFPNDYLTHSRGPKTAPFPVVSRLMSL